LRIVIVDAFSTGALLAAELAARGMLCIHVRSMPTLEPYLARTFLPDAFMVDLGYGSTEQLTRQLRQLGVSAVVAGAESGVLLAERLAFDLGVPGNEPSPAHRDKDRMAAVWARAGVLTPRGVTVTSHTRAPDAVSTLTGEGFVVKPVDSAGSDNVHFCSTSSQVRSAVLAVLSAANFLGAPNRAALIQERATGPEVYVNCVSLNGSHRIVEAWRYTKTQRDDCPVYDFEEPFDLAGQDGNELSTFVRRALDALGIRYGATHTEVILTARGPVAIECGARLMGGIRPDVLDKVFDDSTMHCLADILCGGDLDADLPAVTDAPRQHVRYVSLISEHAGVAGGSWRSRIEHLPSCVALSSSLERGSPIPRTTKLSTSPGFVYLMGSEQTVSADYAQLREWERSGLYVESSDRAPAVADAR